MTPKQVTNLIFKYFLVLRDRYNSNDAVLRLMMTKYYDELFQNFEGTYEYVSSQYEHPNWDMLYADVITSFQKTFRQTDVLDSGTDDMIIWHTLSGTDAFHKVCKRVIRHVYNGESYEDCVDDYFHGREPEINELIDQPEPEVPVIAYANLLENGRVEVGWGFDKDKLTDKAKQNLIDMDGMDRLQYLLTGATKLREDRIERLKKYEQDKI